MTYIPEAFKKRAEQRKETLSEQQFLEEESTRQYVPQAFQRRAEQFEQRKSIPEIEEERFLVGPGIYLTASQIKEMSPPGIEETARSVVAPALSEGISSLGGLPIDLINMVGGFEGSPIGEKIREYASSEGIKKTITEPLREKIFGQVTDEEAMGTQAARRFGRLAGPAALAGPLALTGAALGATAGQIAQEKGYGPIGQAVAEISGIVGPQAAKNIVSLAKSSKEPIKQLTMPRIGPKGTKVGIITSEKQKNVIERLNKEAASISKNILEEKQPLIKQIEQGVDFESEWEKGFGKVKQLAEKANPHINTSSLGLFMYDESRKYSGVPKLSPEAEKIVKEVRAFGKKTPENLNDLLKTYRQNNKKVRNVYETSRVTGKQQEYVDFLMDYNRQIINSVKETLPKDSAWVKMFEDTNAKFKSYKDAKAAENLLKPILGENPTLDRLTKYAADPQIQKKLSLYLGQDGADQISKLAADLKIARESVKKISVKEMSKWDAIFPLGYIIPGGELIKIPYLAAKAVKYSRFGYGRFLTGPKKTASYGDLVKAFNDGDKKAYALAAQRLAQELDSEESDNWSQ